MNIIIKSSEKSEAIDGILRDFGCAENATKEQREAAESIVRKTEEIMKGANKHDRY